MTTEHPPVRKREIFGWAMFDFANSSYTTVIVTVAYSVYFTQLVAPADNADFLWSIGVTVSNLLAVLFGPLVGAVADDSGRKKLFLFASYLLCVAATASLWFVRPGMVVTGVVLFIVSNLGFVFGENFAGAFLPEISTPRNIGRVSGLGWGLGYFGGLLCLVLIFPLLQGDFVAANVPGLRLAWVVTAGFFLVAGIPTFVLLKERARRGPKRTPVEYAKVGYARLADTVRSVAHFSQLARFLVAFFVMNAGFAAVIYFSAIYAQNTLGFEAGELIVLFIVVQLSSAAGALGVGYLQDRLGARASLAITLLAWIGVCVGAYFVQEKLHFFAISLVAGLCVGSLQACARAVVGMFSPIEKAGEFFGFWGLAGKAAFAVGPLAFGLLSSITGSQRLAILSVGVFFVLGLLGLLPVDEARGRQAAATWSERHGEGPGKTAAGGDAGLL